MAHRSSKMQPSAPGLHSEASCWTWSVAMLRSLATRRRPSRWAFNASRLHPDIYMNELLIGMRIIHQVLPAILKKLEINDFEVDQSDLRINMRAPRAYADAAVDATPTTDE